MKTQTNVEKLTALVLASGSKAQTAQGVIVAMISSPKTVDEVLRTAEKVHQHFASGSLPASKALAAKNNALSILRQQLRRAQAKLKQPLQSFTVNRDGVAAWKPPKAEQSVPDYLKKAQEDLKKAVDAGQVPETIAAEVLSLLMNPPTEQVEEQPQARRRRNRGRNVEDMPIAA